MNQEKQATSEVMIDTMINKLEKQDQRIYAQEQKLTQLEENVRATPDHSKDITEIKTGVRELSAVSKGQKAFIEKVPGFCRSLDNVTNLLRHPVQSKVEHHHYIPKITWIAAGLFLAFCLVCSSWYMTYRSSGKYQANDIKYRKLKLDADSTFLQYLWRLDSIYLADPDKMQQYVTEQEQLKQKRLELMDQLQTVDGKIGQDIKTGQKHKGGK